jgi:hypothetical protein
MPDGQNGVYRTTDIGVAAALSASGMPFKGIELEVTSPRYPRGRVIFQFEDAEKAKEKVQSFYGRKLQVDAHTLLSTLRDFRALIFNKEQIGGGQ